MAERSASIRDVAAMSGVSHQTVSRVLNSPEQVAPSTRARVERAIRALGYHPNAAARSLRSQRTRTVGVLVASTSMFVAMDGLSQLELHLRTAGLRMLICGLQGEGYAAVAASVAPLLEYDVDAVVIAANQRSAADLARELARTRTVVAMQPGITADDGLSSVAVDFDAGVATVVDHLVERGHTTLDFIPGPSHLTTVEARTNAWVKELAARRLPLRPLVPTAMTTEGGYRAGRRLLTEGLPDAVFAVNDLAAFGILRAFQEAGVRVPEDVAVVGMDNFFGSELVRPALTTLDQPWSAMGESTAALVIEALAGEPPRTVRLRPELVVRESTAGTRATHATHAPSQA